MLFYHLDVVLKCFLAFWAFALAIAFTAYTVNSRRATNDPKRRYYHPVAILLVPFIFLIVTPIAISLFILAAILYGGFLIFFALLLVTLRRPFLLIWWRKFATLAGEPLLKIGTYLILLPFRLLSPPRGPSQRPAPA